MSVDEAEVRRAVLSFPPGSAGGPDGLRPQHIRDMLMCQEAGAEILSILTDCEPRRSRSLSHGRRRFFLVAAFWL